MRYMWRRVSPAHAGIDLSKIAPYLHIKRFPAHAGIDPRTPLDAPTAYGFPRPRGDRPAYGPMKL